MKTLLRIATSPDLKENGALLDEILTCESWHTLTTFAREMARKSSSRRRSLGHLMTHTIFLSSCTTSVVFRTDRRRADCHGRGHPTGVVRTIRTGCSGGIRRLDQDLPALHIREHTWRARLRGVRFALVLDYVAGPIMCIFLHRRAYGGTA